MTRTICEPCCAPAEYARSNESFKAAVLKILCLMLDELVEIADQSKRTADYLEEIVGGGT